MKRILTLLVVCLALGGQVAAQSTWTISVANNGTMGGYFETADGASQHAVAYDTTWPSGGLVPTLYIHFPQGSFTVTSDNAYAVRATVVRVATETTVVSSQSARNFSLSIPAEGWYRLKLTGGTAGSTTLSDFTVTGTASGTNSSTEVFLADWRSVASLHLNGFNSTDTTMPSGDAFDWAYDEVLIPTDADFLGTYVESFGFSGGYMGIQNNGGNAAAGGRTVIFSLWDSGNTDTDASLADYKRSGVLATGQAESVVSTRFGGEGTGASIRLTGETWKPGQWVKFLLNSRPEEITLDDGTLWQNTLVSAWYWAEGVDTEWHYIGTMREAGRNLYLNPYNAFLEEYTRGSTSQGNKAHKAYYRRIFTRAMESGLWYNRNSFWFGNTDNNDGHRGDFYQTGTTYDGEPAMYMESGGYTRYGNEIGTTSIALKEPEGIVPTDDVLQTLLTRDVLPAIQQQDEDRMASAIANKTHDTSSGWEIMSYSDEEQYYESSGEQGLASLVLDGDDTTYWHSRWSYNVTGYPHYFELKNTEGEVEVAQIVITGHSNHSSDTYQAKTVQVLTSTNGSSWTLQGTYSLSAGFPQTIVLSSPVTTQYLKLNFTEGQTSSNHMCIAELSMVTNNLTKIKALAKTYLDNADQWGGYSTADLAGLQAVYDNSASTYADYETALTALAANGTVLKYGKLTAIASLSAEKAYVLHNKNAWGELVYDATNSRATLRNADGDALETAGRTQYKSTYTQRADVADANSNWMLISGTDDDEGYYYLYNIGAQQYFDVSDHSFSSTPVATTVSYNSTDDYFNFYKKGTSYSGRNHLCAAPQLAEGSCVTTYLYDDEGCQWYLYDNYSYTPSQVLVQQLRVEAGLRSDAHIVTWVVKDTSDNTLYTLRKTYDGEVTGYPDELIAYESQYVSYPDKAAFTAFTPTSDVTVNVTAQPADGAPFAWATSYSEAKSYLWNMNKKSGNNLIPRYLTTDNPRSTPLGYVDGAQTAAYYQGAETYTSDLSYRWRFTGNPFTGFTIYNEASGETYTMQDSGGTTSPADNATYPVLATTGSQTWDVLPNSTGTDGFTFKLHDSENVYMNNNRGINYLGYWISSNGLNDAGGYMQVMRPEEVTVTFVLDGTSYSYDVDVMTGVALTSYPAELTALATERYLTLSPAAPSLTPTTDQTVTVGWTFTPPFTMTADVQGTHALHTLQLRNSYAFAGTPDDANGVILFSAPSPVVQSRWFFTGDPFEGIVVRPEAYPAKGLAVSGFVSLSENPTRWDIVRVSDTQFSLRDKTTSYFASDWTTYIGLWSDNSDSGMYFQAQSADLSDLFEGGYYRVRNVGDDTKYLTTDNGTLAVTDATTDMAQTIFRFAPRGDGYFTVGKVNEYVKEVTDATYGTTAATSTDPSEAYGSYVVRNDDGSYSFTIHTDASRGFAHIDASGNVVRWETSSEKTRWTFSEPTSDDVTVTLNNVPNIAGGNSDVAFATAYMPYAYTLSSGVEALVVKPSADKKRAMCYTISGGKVPEATAVILLGDAGTNATLTPALVDLTGTDDANLVAENELLGTFVSLPSEPGILVLGIVQDVPGFYQLQSGTSLLPYKGYLDFTGSSVRRLDLSIGEATGIETVAVGAASDAVFDLQGRRIAKPAKGGIYIVGGKKTLMK